MKLSDLNLPISDTEAKKLGLVFTQEIAIKLIDLHRMYGSQNFVPMPSLLIDTRLVLCADILIETEPGGLLYEMWSAVCGLGLHKDIEIIPWNELKF